MDMQDKDFDELFRSKLDDFGTEPSASVWPGIAADLNTGTRKKALMPWLSAAASIIVLVTAGILFIPKKTVTVINPQVKGSIAKAVNVPVSIAPATINHSSGIKKSNNPVGIKNIHSIRLIKNGGTNGINVVKNLDTVNNGAKLVKEDDQRVMASLQPKQSKEAIVPDKGTILTPKLTDMQPVAFTAKPGLLANQLPDISKKDSTPVKSRHKIRSLGDLLNVVVAKVDKRKDKVIEFSDNDDNESNLVGVNLGIIKIKKGE
jgi:hypothetical protein